MTRPTAPGLTVADLRERLEGQADDAVFALWCEAAGERLILESVEDADQARGYVVLGTRTPVILGWVGDKGVDYQVDTGEPEPVPTPLEKVKAFVAGWDSPGKFVRWADQRELLRLIEQIEEA